MLSIGCTPTSSVKVLPRLLPPTPAFATPVKVLKPPASTDWEIVAKREQNGRLANAARLNCLVRWIEERRIELAGGTVKLTKGCPQS